MARPLDHERRTRLLAGVVDYIAAHGLSELSLRPLAAELGTSSRMLIYYFGTKEELLVQALATQRPDIAAVFAGVADAATLRRRLTDLYESSLTSDGAISIRVMLQVLGAACAPGSPYDRYARDAIAVFVEALSAALARIGVEEPSVVATLLISGMRGILQDRLITGDVERTSRAGRRLVEAHVR